MNDNVNHKLSATILRFDTPQDDETVLVRAAPWLREELDMGEEWRRCLFMTRFAKHIDAAMGRSTVANINWKIDRGTVKGKIATQAGNVIVSMFSLLRGSYACFEGHREALLHAGVAREHWLNPARRPRGMPAETFDENIFDAKRSVTINRNRDRRAVSISFTAEEDAQVQPDRFKQLTEAKSSVRHAVEKLTHSRSDFQRRFSGLVSLTADLMEHHAFMSEGGFSLDDSSRAAILTQLNSLRQTFQQVTVRFDRNERIADIESIAQKHAREVSSLVSIVSL